MSQIFINYEKDENGDFINCYANDNTREIGERRLFRRDIDDTTLKQCLSDFYQSYTGEELYQACDPKELPNLDPLINAGYSFIPVVGGCVIVIKILKAVLWNV